MTLILGSLHIGLIYALLGIGVYITFRVLDIPDLTADGSLTLGLAVSGIMTINNQSILGLVLAFIAGCIAGSVTGLLQTKFGIHPILSGILTMSGLYSINLLIMGASNISLIGKESVFKIFEDMLGGLDKDIVRLIVCFVVCFVVSALFILFFKTRLGLMIRATGNNEHMVKASSINVDFIKIFTLAIANGCVSLSGGLLAQYQSFSDISSGVGTVVIVLASVIIGEVLFGRRTVTIGIISAVVGSIIYRLIIALALQSSIFPSYMLKLVSAVIVGVALSIPTIKKSIENRKLRKGGI